MEQTKSIYNTTQNTETETFKKPSDKLNTGSTIRTSTVPKWPHPKLGMTGGRKPAANASATGASAPKAAVGTANALGPPAGSNKNTEWRKKVVWAKKVLPNYGQDKPTQEGTHAIRQRSLELP